MHHPEMLGFELDKITTWLFVLFPWGKWYSRILGWPESELWPGLLNVPNIHYFFLFFSTRGLPPPFKLGSHLAKDISQTPLQLVVVTMDCVQHSSHILKRKMSGPYFIFPFFTHGLIPTWWCWVSFGSEDEGNNQGVCRAAGRRVCEFRVNPVYQGSFIFLFYRSAWTFTQKRNKPSFLWKPLLLSLR